MWINYTDERSNVEADTLLGNCKRFAIGQRFLMDEVWMQKMLYETMLTVK
jgi:hypothetical protein